MLTLEKLRSFVTHKQQTMVIPFHSDKQEPTEKPEVKAVVQLAYRSRSLSIGAFSEKLYPHFCDDCKNPQSELLAFKGNIALVYCKTKTCSRFFRIDTAT